MNSDYTEAVRERSKFVGYQFCVVFLKPHEQQYEFEARFKRFLHVHNGHTPADKVFDMGSGLYLAVVEGSSDSFRRARGLPSDTETRSVDALIEKFMLSEVRSGAPVDVSIGIAEYDRNTDILYQLAAFSQRQWTAADGALVSKAPVPFSQLAKELSLVG